MRPSIIGTIIINLYDCIHRLRFEYEYNYSALRCNALHKYEKYKHNIILYKYKIIYIQVLCLFMYKKRSSTSKHDPSDPTVRFKTYTYADLRIIRALCGVLNVYYYCNKRPYRCFGQRGFICLKRSSRCKIIMMYFFLRKLYCNTYSIHIGKHGVLIGC